MTPSFGPDEMRNIKLSVLDVRVLMEALFVRQLLVATEKERAHYFSSYVDGDDNMTYCIKRVFFRPKAGKYMS